MSRLTYMRIEIVLKSAGRAMAPHELEQVRIGDLNGREYIGQSEATIGRRMRELVVMGRLTSRRREGKNFKEFALAVREVCAAAL
jgi:hypothetical protein